MNSLVENASDSALASLRWLFQQDGDPVGSELADVALDDAALALWKSGLLT